MKNLPRPILRWKREISQASFCQCYNWKQTRYGSPVLPPPHWEVTRASPSQTWRGCVPASGLQEGAFWRQTLPRTPGPWAPYALLHKWLLDHSLSGWQPCWDGWVLVELSSPPPLLWWEFLVPYASGWTPRHPEAWRRLHGSQRRGKIRARGRWTAQGHLLPSPGWAGSCLEKQEWNGQKVSENEETWRLERGPLTEGQILWAKLVRKRPHGHRNRTVIVSYREKKTERSGKPRPYAGSRKNRIPITAWMRLMSFCWCLSVCIL